MGLEININKTTLICASQMTLEDPFFVVKE